MSVTPYHMSVDISNPTPIQSMKTTHSNSFNISTKPISRTRPKPTVDTAQKTWLASFISKPFPCFITSAHHTARRWAAPGTQGRPEPTGLWSVCGSGSCGTLSAAMWTGRASATRQTQNPSVWNAGVAAGTCSAWLRPCAAQHLVRSGCRSGGSASATYCGGMRERCRYYKHINTWASQRFIHFWKSENISPNILHTPS